LLGQVRRALGPVEHKVGAHLQQATTRGSQGLSKSRRGAGIDGLGQLGLLFGAIHRRIGTGIEHPIRAVPLHYRLAGHGVSEIQFSPAAGDQRDTGGLSGDKGLAQLAGSAGK
jgi:hypothetical protein